MAKNPISSILIFNGYLNALLLEKKSKKWKWIPIWNIDQVKFDFLDDFFQFFGSFLQVPFLKNEPDEGYSKDSHLAEKKSGYLILWSILNFNEALFQKKIIKVTTDLEYRSEIFLIFLKLTHVKHMKMKGRKPLGGNMKEHMRELGHSRDRKSVV